MKESREALFLFVGKFLLQLAFVQIAQYFKGEGLVP